MSDRLPTLDIRCTACSIILPKPPWVRFAFFDERGEAEKLRSDKERRNKWIFSAHSSLRLCFSAFIFILNITYLLIITGSVAPEWEEIDSTFDFGAEIRKIFGFFSFGMLRVNGMERAMGNLRPMI